MTVGIWVFRITIATILALGGVIFLLGAGEGGVEYSLTKNDADLRASIIMLGAGTAGLVAAVVLVAMWLTC